ncbi:MAG: hypothetical protein ACK53Y_23525, partial [bacterium]
MICKSCNETKKTEHSKKGKKRLIASLRESQEEKEEMKKEPTIHKHKHHHRDSRPRDAFPDASPDVLPNRMSAHRLLNVTLLDENLPSQQRVRVPISTVSSQRPINRSSVSYNSARVPNLMGFWLNFNNLWIDQKFGYTVGNCLYD